MLSKVYLGLGSNLGNRKQNLDAALRLIESLSRSPLRVSSCYDTEALLPDRPERLPPTWNQRYLNQVVEMETDLDPASLLMELQQIEAAGGRKRREKWAPRTLDIDIIAMEGFKLQTPDLTVPHPEAARRAFVLDGLKDLNASLRLGDVPVLWGARRHSQHQAQLMGILNLTPDSFSDGGELNSHDTFLEALQDMEDVVGIVDLGAESTRPGATPLTWQDEWRRLQPYLEITREYFSGRRARPWISVDTRHAETAARALEYGIEMINDVSGLASSEMHQVLAASHCHYVLTHSLTVPADKNRVLHNQPDVIEHLLSWVEHRLHKLTDAGIRMNRIVFDPGIGFGKSARQSQEIIRRIEEFQVLPCRLLIGHSRKSFLEGVTTKGFRDRDIESAALSVKLQLSGIEILRVHNPNLHARSLRAVGLCQ